MVFIPAFSSTYENPMWKDLNHVKEPRKLPTSLHQQERFKKQEKAQMLTPRMQYQSTNDGLAEFERSLWTHTTERVAMEQISNTNWVLESDSCPILPIWEWNDFENVEVKDKTLKRGGLQIVKFVSFCWFWEGSNNKERWSG